MRAALAALLAFCAPAYAEPAGAPWDHDGAPGRADCTACHFSAEPVKQSDALQIRLPQGGLSASGEADVTLTLRTNAPAAGFLLTATAGEFLASGEDQETSGARLRSTALAEPGADGVFEWKVRWRAPAGVTEAVTFYAAVNAANLDASPFGDVIHLQARTVVFRSE